MMEKRIALRKAYGKGWDTWDADLLISTLAPGFVFDDPEYPEPVTAANIAVYMAGWKDRVLALGGTGELGSRDRVYQDQDGAYVSWHWWSFVGTPFEGSAVTRTTDEGVLYERMTYCTPKNVASARRPEEGLVVQDAEVQWQGWSAGSEQTSEPRYKTLFAAGETPTNGLVQGVLEYPPGARSLAHWHTPVETYYVLSGTGVGRIGDATLPIGPGAAVYVPSRAVHWFESTGDEPLRVLWTLNCDAVDDIDFNFVE